MKKYLLMAVVAVMLMSQFAEAGLLARIRARRRGVTTRPAAAAPATPAPATAPAAAAPAAAPTTPTPPAPSK